MHRSHCIVPVVIALQLGHSVPASKPAGLSIAGTLFMIGSIGGVLALVAWCYSRLLRDAPPSESDDHPNLED